MSSQIYQEAHKWRVLKEQLLNDFPDLDEQTLFDTLEGLTDINEMIAELARSLELDKAMAEGVRKQELKLANKRTCLIARAQRKREFLFNLMSEMDLKKVNVCDVTVSRRKVPPKLLTDEDRIPDSYKIEEVTYKLDKDLIKKDLDAGKTIEGASMSNGGECLSIRI